MPEPSSPPTDPLVARYLQAIGARAEPPSVAALVRLHRAHVLRFPHDTVAQARGRTPVLDQVVVLEALLGGEGGSCIRLNGSFAWLLGALGYAVTMHRCRVQRGLDTQARPRMGMHLVLRVELPDGTWHADVGLGNGPLDPLPLREGSWRQDGGFEYALRRTGDDAVPWRFEHDRALRGLRAVEVEAAPSELAGFADVWRDGSSPETVASLPITVNRRLEDRVLTLAGTSLVTCSEGHRQVRVVEDAREWERTLREDLGLALPGWSDAERDRLWQRCLPVGLAAAPAQVGSPAG